MVCRSFRPQPVVELNVAAVVEPVVAVEMAAEAAAMVVAEAAEVVALQRHSRYPGGLMDTSC